MATKTVSEPIWEIYCASCAVNGKRYIGLTKHGTDFRWSKHVLTSQGQRKRGAIHNAIRKYGVDNFEVETLYAAISLREAIAVERGLIAAYGTLYPAGYNLTIGGDGYDGTRRSLENRRKISEAQTGRPIPPEQRQKISQALTGIVRSNEFREKMRLIALTDGRAPPQDCVTRAKATATRLRNFPPKPKPEPKPRPLKVKLPKVRKPYAHTEARRLGMIRSAIKRKGRVHFVRDFLIVAVTRVERLERARADGRFPGIHRHGKKWRYIIQIRGKTIRHSFATAAEAFEALMMAAHAELNHQLEVAFQAA